MGTKDTNSNVAWQRQSFHTGGHEKDHSGQCKNEPGGLQSFEEGGNEEVAGRSDDEFRDLAGLGEDFGSGDTDRKSVV